MEKYKNLPKPVIKKIAEISDSLNKPYKALIEKFSFKEPFSDTLENISKFFRNVELIFEKEFEKLQEKEFEKLKLEYEKSDNEKEFIRRIKMAQDALNNKETNTLANILKQIYNDMPHLINLSKELMSWQTEINLSDFLKEHLCFEDDRYFAIYFKFYVAIKNEIDKTEKTQIQLKEEESQTVKFDFDKTRICNIYDFCVKEDIFQNISITDFISYVETANFKSIIENKDTKEMQLKRLIYRMSKIMDGAWYSKTAISINTSPQKCSGAKVPDFWDEKCDKILPKLKK